MIVTLVLVSALTVWLTVLAVRYCWVRGHRVAAVLSVIFPYLTVPYVWILGDSQGKLRRDAVARGVDLSHWVPTYVDMGNRDSDGDVVMNYSFAVATPTHVLFYECERGLYAERGVRDPFPHARRYIGKIAKDSVTNISVTPLNPDAVKSLRRSAFWKNLAFNQTIGRVLPASNKTVVMSALVVAEMVKRADAAASHVIFGIPHTGDTSGSAGWIGDLLPDHLETLFDIGKLGVEYANCGERDARAAINALAVASGLLRLLGRPLSQRDGTSSITAISDEVVAALGPDGWTRLGQAKALAPR